MSEVTIYHNPRCSKSRQTLALIENAGVEPIIVLYLQVAPSAETLGDIVQKLDVDVSAIVRKGEDIYKTLKLKEANLSHEEWLVTLSNNPKLIERPIVVKANKAIVGRPPENVLELLN